MTSRPLGTALGVVAAVVVLASGPAASAEEIDVNGPTTFDVTGHGWGHGHGLSQYGALGAAKQGVGWRRIVRFYYPGTRLGRAHGPIKVLLTADTSKDVTVLAREGLRLHRLGGRSYLLDQVRPRATQWRIVPKGSSRSVVSFRADRGGWKRWTAFPGGAEFVAGGKPITLRLPHRRTASYRGALRSVQKDTVNVLALDRYVQGVVPQEMPPEWPTDAVRAQAVAARTYAAYERANATSYYDICDTTSCQVYGGYDAEHPSSNSAVKRTRGRVVTYAGEPAFTQFSSSNGGWSSAGSQPYLVAQEDPYEAASGNPYATWKAKLTSRQIEKEWPGIGDLRHISLTRDGHGDFGGRVLSATLSGSTGSVSVTGDDLRFLMGAAGRSTWFGLAKPSAKELARRLFSKP